MQAFLALLLLANINLPSAYVNVLTSVEFHSESGYLQIDGQKEEISGKSVTRSGEVDVYAMAFSVETIVHEIGHNKCDRMGNPAPFGQGDTITAYGRTNAKEDCADTFMAYYMRDFPDESGENARCDFPTLRKERPLVYKKCLMISRWDKAARAAELQ